MAITTEVILSLLLGKSLTSGGRAGYWKTASNVF